ncbi:MAG TPA: peptidylprolyl isomerase [Betaproteobacteria bacterium]|nr:peptidylprolyl isomerase [Betaproteobacteria bacterium]
MSVRWLLYIGGMLISLSAFAANPLVQIKTNMGTMVFELYPAKAPLTVKNFLAYVDSGYYDGTIFHRAINHFIIQGGGYTANLKPKPTLPPIPNEAGNGLKNLPGALAMARSYNPNSATSQFFINMDDNKFLNHYRNNADYYGYCVFGRVVEGMAVAKKIAALPTAAKGFLREDVPIKTVLIEDAKIIDRLPAAIGKGKQGRVLGAGPHHRKKHKESHG